MRDWTVPLLRSVSGAPLQKVLDPPQKITKSVNYYRENLSRQRVTFRRAFVALFLYSLILRKLILMFATIYRLDYVHTQKEG